MIARGKSAKNTIIRGRSGENGVIRLTEYPQPNYPAGLFRDFRHSNPFIYFLYASVSQKLY